MSNIEHWATQYQEKKTFWQMNCVNPTLIQNLTKLTGDEGTENKKKFFVPLAGKSMDVPYLLEQGHQVFVVEAVQQTIEELDVEHKLQLKFNPIDSIYYTDDKKLIIYLGDLFQCPIEKWGPFDCVWDRGSFVAISYELRQAYKSMMQRALSVPNEGASGDFKYHDFRYLLTVFEYDKDKFDRSPRAVSEGDMKQFFGDWTEFLMLDKVLYKDRGKKRPGLPDDTTHIVYLLTPKN